MKFSFDASRTCGTHLIGNLNTTYDKLVSVFGEPNLDYPSGDGKVQVEWAMVFEDGTVATIYDWKECCSPDRVTDWHVGGFDRKALWHVTDTLNGVQG